MVLDYKQAHFHHHRVPSPYGQFHGGHPLHQNQHGSHQQKYYFQSPAFQPAQPAHHWKHSPAHQQNHFPARKPNNGQQLNQKQRAKSVPNLEAADVPEWVWDERNRVNYAIGQMLGRGGFAKCFLACSNKQYFALKVISRESIRRDAYQLGKIRREIQIHFNLRHPNIVALYSTFECARNIYMLLELCPNRTLAEHIDNAPGRCLPEPTAVVFMKQLLLAVRYLHEECALLHRDIKPGNVLLSREWTVKLADFGFCCSIAELNGRKSHTICGTPNYVAPEVIDKLGHTIFSDCWSLGCTFYAMLFGRPPFHSENLQQTYSRIRCAYYKFPEEFGVSSRAREMIERTLIVRPEWRLNASQMLAQLALNPNQFSPLFEEQNYSNSNGSGDSVNSTQQFLETTNFSSLLPHFHFSGSTGHIPAEMPTNSNNNDTNNYDDLLLGTDNGNGNDTEGNTTIFEKLGEDADESESQTTVNGGDGMTTKYFSLQNLSNLLPAIDDHSAPSTPSQSQSGINISNALANNNQTAGSSTASATVMNTTNQSSSAALFLANSTAPSSSPFVGASSNLLGGGTTTAITDSGLGGSSEPLLPTNHGNSAFGKMVQFTLDKYTGALQALMDDYNPLSLVPTGTSADGLPTSFVAKWVDYTNKFGFGVTLRDGTRSILFNDHSSLSSTHCQDNFSFHANKFNENCLEWTARNGVPNADLSNKVSILQCLRDYMDRELHSSVPIKHRWYGTGQRTSLVHLIDYRKFADGLFMFLSDGTCQVNFGGSHHKLAMCAVQNPGGQDGLSYQLHLITGGTQQCYSFTSQPKLFLFGQRTADINSASPLSDHDWALVRDFKRVLHNYQQALFGQGGPPAFSTYC